MNKNNPLIARLLLLSTVVFLTLSGVLSIALIRASRPRLVSLEEISTSDRQRLVEDFFEVSTRAYTPAWFEPAVRYTLRTDSAISVFDSDFPSNELGYRTGPVEKAPGIFRVVFVGDSWTYGMGVDEVDSFPAQFAKAINEVLGGNPEVEAWNLALPAYNTFTEAAALEVFLERLQPDAVVFCPTPNDNDSAPTVVPAGATKRLVGRSLDLFGWDHSVVYRLRFINSPGYLERWRRAFTEIHRVENFLNQREIPMMLFFVARWNGEFVHHFVEDAGIESPYVITPEELTRGKWMGPQPWGHGTPACYTVMGIMAQQGLAEILGWPKADSVAGFLPAEVHRWGQPRAGAASFDEVVRGFSVSQLTEGYDPKIGDETGCVGPMNCRTGEMGRAATFVFKRAPGSRKIVIEFNRVAAMRTLYPQKVAVRVVHGNTSVEQEIVIEAQGADEFVVEMGVPPAAREGDAIDLEIRAERAAVGVDDLYLRSVVVKRIWQTR